MFYPKSAFQSKIYTAFKDIQPSEYRVIARFFEDNEQDIRRLQFEQYFELLFIYSSAIFEIGAYAKYISIAPEILEGAIIHNVQYLQGVDIFQVTLYKKSVAHYNLRDYSKTDHLLRELIRIDPSNQLAIQLLKKNIRKSKPTLVRTIYAVSVLCFMLSALVIFFELIAVKHFFEEWLFQVQVLRNVLFALGILVVLIGEVYLKMQAEVKVDRFVKAILDSKALS